MARYIRFFKKDNEEFAGEILVSIDVNILRKNFYKINDPMFYYSYHIKPEDSGIFLQFLDNYKFDFLNFDYYLEYI
jgi:hypothetical protein